MTWLRDLFARLRRRDDDTAQLPVIHESDAWPHELTADVSWPPEPDEDGWSYSVGWNYREKFDWIVAGWDPTPAETSIFDEMGGDRVLAGHRPQLAIESGRPRELEGAAS